MFKTIEWWKGIQMIEENIFFSRVAGPDIVEENDKIWLSMIDRNGICEIDKITRKANVVAIFRNESLLKQRLYFGMAKYKNKIVFAPDMANEIAIFDVNDKSVQYIKLNEVEKKSMNQQMPKFWKCISHKSDIYLMGYTYPAIIKISMDTLEVNYISDWIKYIEEKKCRVSTCGYISDGYVIKDNKMLLPMGGISALLELDLVTNETKIINVDTPFEGIGGIASIDNKTIWMVGRGNKDNSSLLCWNTEEKEMKKVKIPIDTKDVFDPFYAPKCLGDKVFLFAISAPQNYEIDSNKLTIKPMNITTGTSSKLFKWVWNTIVPREEAGLLKYISGQNFEWYEYNINTSKIEKYVIELNDSEQINKYVKEYSKDYLKKNILVGENEKYSLKFFIEGVKGIGSSNLKNEYIHSAVGSRIHNYMKMEDRKNS